MIRYGLLVLTMCLAAAGSLRAAEDEAASFELAWRQNSFADSFNIEIDRRTPFAGEPDFGEQEIWRGVIPVGPDEQPARFAWDPAECRLYVDLNRDGDLSNDPNNMIVSKDPPQTWAASQNFPPFSLYVTTPAGLHRYEVAMYLYASEWSRQARYTIQSGWEGDVELAGRKWRLRVVDPIRGEIRRGDELSVWPADRADANGISSLPLTQSVFIGGRCYDVAFAFEDAAGESPVLRGTLRQRQVPLATLQIEGQRIGGMVLGNDEMLVLPELEAAGDGQPVPAGDYTCKSLVLRIDKDKVISPQRLHTLRVKATPGETAVFRAGAPLKHGVTVERMGRVLEFNYELAGIGGETYTVQEITGYEDARQPMVTVSKGDLQLASGSFEYG